MSKHITSKFMHIVLSPKVCPSAAPLLNFLMRSSENWIVSNEEGHTGHPHIECFTELKSPKRIDHVKRSILKLYPEIPKEQQRNVKVTINSIDSDPRYGYGYSLKEGVIYDSTFTTEYEQECLDYYNAHKERVENTKSKFLEKHKNKSFGLDQLGEELLDYLALFYTDHAYDPNENIQWLIDNFLQIQIKDRKLKLTTFLKVSDDKLEKFCRLFLGAVLLTAPLPTPPTINAITNNPLINL